MDRYDYTTTSHVEFGEHLFDGATNEENAIDLCWNHGDCSVVGAALAVEKHYRDYGVAMLDIDGDEIDVRDFVCDYLEQEVRKVADERAAKLDLSDQLIVARGKPEWTSDMDCWFARADVADLLKAYLA